VVEGRRRWERNPGTSTSTMTDEPEQKFKSEWRAVFPPEQFRTERHGAGEYEYYMEQGVYSCAGCGTQLYKSRTRFLSGCGWSAFLDGPSLSYRRPHLYSAHCIAIAGAVNRHEAKSLFMTRTEITCVACGGRLGHMSTVATIQHQSNSKKSRRGLDAVPSVGTYIANDTIYRVLTSPWRIQIR